MLVLTRRCGEAIKIGEEVQVTIVDVESGKVRIGVDAPEDVSISRGAVDQGRADNFAASPANLDT